MPNVNRGVASTLTPNIQNQQAANTTTNLTTFASLPAANTVNPGTVAYTSDQGMCVSNGTAWTSIGGGGAGSTTAQISASTYGISPTNTAVVNDTGFAAMKAAMLATPNTTWFVTFAPGAYTYTNNRWLFGVQKVVISAYDCTFQCIWSTDANLANCVPFNINDFLQDWGDLPWPGTAVYANGFLFNTVAAGAFSVTTTTAADAGNFTPGMRVILMGYDQQGTGYPPNMRYFEYKTVVSGVAGTGVVTFTTAIEYLYDSRWWDVANYAGSGKAFGAPRILSLERANKKQAKLIWIKGATLLANPTTPGGTGMLSISADMTIFEDMTALSFNVVMADTTIIRRSKFSSVLSSDQNSSDKLVNRVVVEDCILDGTTPAIQALAGCPTGRIELIRSTLYGTVSQVAPRSLYINDCDIIPASGSFSGISTSGGQPMVAADIQNTRVYNPGSLGYGFSNVASPGLSLTVGSVVGTDIRISFDATGQTVAHNIDYGMTLTNTVTGNTGIITAIYYETGAPGTLRIAGTWSTPTASDVFHFYDVMQIADAGGNVIVGAQVPFYRAPPGPVITDSSMANSTVTTQLVFPASPGTAVLQNKSYGIQHLGNSVNTFYEDSSGIHFQGTNGLTFSLGGGLQFTEGANAIEGVTTLVAGTVTVSTTAAVSTCRIMLTRSTTGGTVGHLSYTISNGVSFTINSSLGTDTSTINWLILNHG